MGWTLQSCLSWQSGAPSRSARHYRRLPFPPPITRRFSPSGKQSRPALAVSTSHCFHTSTCSCGHRYDPHHRTTPSPYVSPPRALSIITHAHAQSSCCPATAMSRDIVSLQCNRPLLPASGSPPPTPSFAHVPTPAPCPRLRPCLCPCPRVSSHAHIRIRTRVCVHTHVRIHTRVHIRIHVVIAPLAPSMVYVAVWALNEARTSEHRISMGVVVDPDSESSGYRTEGARSRGGWYQKIWNGMDGMVSAGTEWLPLVITFTKVQSKHVILIAS